MSDGAEHGRILAFVVAIGLLLLGMAVRRI